MQITRNIKFVFAAAAVTACVQESLAQWSTDPLINTPVAVTGGDQGVPVIRERHDGGAWVSYMSNGAGSGYKPMIQRLDVDGFTLLGTGVQLADRHNTATFIYDMTTDNEGSAIVAFDDDSTGTTMVTVQKVMPDGSLPWGATGKQIAGSTGALAPRVAGCADGTIVVAWALSNVLNFQRLDASGLPIGAAWSVTEAGHYQAFCDIKAVGTGGEFISMWVRGETTSAITSRKGLKIQKWNSGSNGNAAMWNGGTAIDIYTSAVGKSIQNGYFPLIHSDLAGGAFTAWYDNGNTRNAWLQHIDSAGNMQFAAEGLGMTTNGSATEYRLSASVARDENSGDFIVAWQRSNTLQSQFGMNAQRVTAEAVLLWGEAGATVVPMGGFQSSFIHAFDGDAGDAYLMWIQYTGAVTQEIQAAKLDGTGAFAWPTPITRMASRVSSKGRLGAVGSNTRNMAIAVWADGSSGDSDILAQNIGGDGLLGPICGSDFNFDRVVDFFDYLDFVAAFSNQEWEADFNRDDVIDFFDYLDFVAAFSTGC